MEELRETFGRTLVELGQANPNVYVLDADLNTSTRTVYFARAFPLRFIQVGIAEQNMIGIAAGLALEGKIPFPTTFADFITKRACDQVSISVAYPKLNVKLAGAYPGLFTGKAGATHQSVQDLANMRAMPGMRVVAPGDPREVRAVMWEAANYLGPVYFRVPRIGVRPFLPEDYKFEWGRGVEVAAGRDATIIATGVMTQWALAARDLLSPEGISARVIHMPCLKPIDEEIIVKAARETASIVTVENHSIIGGLGSAVAEVLGENRPAPLRRVGVRDTFTESGEDDELVESYGLSSGDIARAVRDLLRESWVPAAGDGRQERSAREGR